MDYTTTKYNYVAKEKLVATKEERWCKMNYSSPA